MNIQQSKTLMSQIKAMQSEGHKLLFAYFAPTRDFHFSDISDVEEMHKSWNKFRAHCKINNIQLQGVRRFKTSIKRRRQILEVAFFVPRASIEAIKNQLSDAFPKPNFKITIMETLTEEGAIQYIENKMLHPDQASENPTLINATPNPLATQTQQ
ncbi:hypothetical protein [Marinomonas lutimaris]|uniref:hypothetical protein n=1 Tax=Marinomonas lutimaris TaxID=2846746 RepID=UPI001CA59D7C|nr:hypothetical protein [Marinomonas lutimaris]